MNWKEALYLFCEEGVDDGMRKPLPETPSADDFFEEMQRICGRAPHNWNGTSDTEYRYQDVAGYGWLAWGKLYIAIPEYDTYERHSGKWAVAETLCEAVRECVHTSWRQEAETIEFKREINEYLSKL
jgi:hypothetical protein